MEKKEKSKIKRNNMKIIKLLAIKTWNIALAIKFSIYSL